VASGIFLSSREGNGGGGFCAPYKKKKVPGQRSQAPKRDLEKDMGDQGKKESYLRRTKESFNFKGTKRWGKPSQGIKKRR